MQNAPKTGKYLSFNANLRIFLSIRVQFRPKLVKIVTFLKIVQETQTKLCKIETIFLKTEKIFPETETQKSKN